MRCAATSLKALMAPSRMPIAVVETERTKSWPKGILKSGPSLSAWPGLRSVKPSEKRWVRYSGTKQPSMTTSLEPVARSPMTFQVSSIR